MRNINFAYEILYSTVYILPVPSLLIEKNLAKHLIVTDIQYNVVAHMNACQIIVLRKAFVIVSHCGSRLGKNMEPSCSFKKGKLSMELPYLE